MRPDDRPISVWVEPVETLRQAQGERLPVHKAGSISYLTQAASLAATGGPASPGARAADYAKGVRAKFCDGVARSDQRVILNFDLTPFASPHLLHLTTFASKPGLPTTNHIDPKKLRR